MDPLRRHARGAGGEGGFTLIELLVASVVSMLVLGGAVALTSQIQGGYRRQVEDAAAQQEGRYALEWIGKLIRGADNNPFSAAVTQCPSAATPFVGVVIDPDGDGVNDDIRLQTDSNPPDGQVGGLAGQCTQANEDVTIEHDAVNDTIRFRDMNVGAAEIRTDRVIDDLRFVYRDTDHNIELDADEIVFVETQITVRSRTLDPSTGAPVTRILTSEVRVRSR